MKLMLSAAPCALLLAVQASSTHAQTPPVETATLDTVIVTGRRNSDDPPVVAEARARLSRTPGAVAVVSSESYAGRRATNLADILRDVPGVYAQTKWGGDIRLSIRGSGVGNANHNRGTLLAQDGIPFNEADGYGDFQLIDPLIARYTEVYKGGNALRFGGSLLGGAVNLVTPTGRTAGHEALLRVDGGSDQSLRGHAELARQWDAGDLFVAFTGARADGWREHSSGQQQYASLNLGRALGQDREIRLIVNGGYVHQEIPGTLSLTAALNAPRAANAGNLALNYQRDMGSVRTTVQTRWRVDDSLVFEGGVYATWKDLDHPIFQVIDQQSRNYGAFGRFDWTGQAFGRPVDVFYGAFYRSGDLDAQQWINLAGSHGTRTANSRQNARALDLFAEGRLFVSDRLAVVAGGSWGKAWREYQSFRLPGVPASFDLTADQDYDWFAPRIGLLWEAGSGAQAYANVTRSVEPPNFSSLAPAADGFKPLKAQEAVTWEAGVRGRTARLAWDVAVYRAELENELLNFIPNAALGIPAATFNAGPTVHQGVEVGLDWRIIPTLRLRQTWSTSDFRFDGDKVYGDARLPVVPEHLYRAELRYDHPSGWYVAPSVEWSPADTWVDYANTLKSPGYAVTSLGAGWSVGRRLSVFIEARNLTDERYVSNFGAVTDARLASTAVFYPGEGRSLYAGVTRRF